MAQKIVPLYTGIFTHNIKFIMYITGHFTLYDIHYRLWNVCLLKKEKKTTLFFFTLIILKFALYFASSHLALAYIYTQTILIIFNAKYAV